MVVVVLLWFCSGGRGACKGTSFSVAAGCSLLESALVGSRDALFMFSFKFF